MNRRAFLRFLGLGAAAAAVLPVDELIDRLEFARSPTTSLYVAPQSLLVQQWEDEMFIEYVKNNPLHFLVGTDQAFTWTAGSIELADTYTLTTRLVGDAA